MKSQFFSAEAIFNISLFTILFMLVLFTLNNKSREFTEATQEDYLIVNSNNIINLLTLSAGYPSNWSSANFIDLGLCDYPKIISNNKLQSFISLLNNNNSLVIESFSIDAYKIYFSLEYLNGTKIAEYKPKGNVKNAMVTKRKVLYNNYGAIMKVGVMN